MKKLIAKTKNFVRENKEKIDNGVIIAGSIATTAVAAFAITKTVIAVREKANDFNEELLNDTQEFIESKQLEDEFLEFIINK